MRIYPTTIRKTTVKSFINILYPRSIICLCIVKSFWWQVLQLTHINTLYKLLWTSRQGRTWGNFVFWVKNLVKIPYYHPFIKGWNGRCKGKELTLNLMMFVSFTVSIHTSKRKIIAMIGNIHISNILINIRNIKLDRWVSKQQ